MSDFIFPSDQDRADNDELNRVCHELEDVMDLAEMDRKMAHVYRVENINLRSRLKALEAHVATLNEKAEAREALAPYRAEHVALTPDWLAGMQ